MPQQASPFTTRTSTPLRSSTSMTSRPSPGALCCTKQVWKRTTSPPGSGFTCPCFSAHASNGSCAKSGRSLSRWMPTAFSMRMRNGRSRLATLAIPNERRAIFPAVSGSFSTRIRSVFPLPRRSIARQRWTSFGKSSWNGCLSRGVYGHWTSQSLHWKQASITCRVSSASTFRASPAWR
jgi:hypothetical protein